MRTVTVGVASLDEAKRGLAIAFAGEAAAERIDFTSIDLLWRVLMPRRLELLRAMAGQGPMAIREAARRLGRDVKGVHGDIHALLAAGILDRTADGQVVFPFDAVARGFRAGSGSLNAAG